MSSSNPLKPKRSKFCERCGDTFKKPYIRKSRDVTISGYSTLCGKCYNEEFNIKQPPRDLVVSDLIAKGLWGLIGLFVAIIIFSPLFSILLQ